MLNSVSQINFFSRQKLVLQKLLVAIHSKNARVWNPRGTELENIYVRFFPVLKSEIAMHLYCTREISSKKWKKMFYSKAFYNLKTNRCGGCPTRIRNDVIQTVSLCFWSIREVRTLSSGTFGSYCTRIRMVLHFQFFKIIF